MPAKKPEKFSLTRQARSRLQQLAQPQLSAPALVKTDCPSYGAYNQQFLRILSETKVGNYYDGEWIIQAGDPPVYESGGAVWIYDVNNIGLVPGEFYLGTQIADVTNNSEERPRFNITEPGHEFYLQTVTWTDQNFEQDWALDDAAYWLRLKASGSAPEWNGMDKQSFSHTAGVRTVFFTNASKLLTIIDQDGGNTDAEGQFFTSLGADLTLPANHGGVAIYDQTFLGTDRWWIHLFETYRAIVSENDQTQKPLKNKLIAGTNMTIVETNDGGDETLVFNASGGSATIPDCISQGRLENNGGNLRWYNWRGNLIRVPNASGTTWTTYSVPTTTIAMPGVAGVYDVLAQDNGAGVTFSTLAWASTTARATNWTHLNGIPVINTGGNAKLLLGTVYDDGSGILAYSVTKRHLWNLYNQEIVKLGYSNNTVYNVGSASTWEYLTGTKSTSQVEFVYGGDNRLHQGQAWCSLAGHIEIELDQTDYGALGINAFGLTSPTKPYLGLQQQKWMPATLPTPNNTFLEAGITQAFLPSTGLQQIVIFRYATSTTNVSFKDVYMDAELMM